MDKISKAFAKFSKKERGWIREILEKLKERNVRGLNIKKLKGREDIFRVRKGDMRILYRQTTAEIFILAIERKSEKTYK
ncbi:MAG: hypothetical protein AAB846_02745 [Patescibacteria group bacterium]